MQEVWEAFCLQGDRYGHRMLVGGQKGDFAIVTMRARSCGSVCTLVNPHGYEGITWCGTICSRKRAGNHLGVH